MATKRPAPVSPVTQQSGSASEILRDLLNQWGIGALYADAMRLIKQGLNENAVLVQLQDTDTYRRRFKGNELRRQKGLQVLSPAEYVATETQYKTVMRQYGLPTGFYDSADDLTRLLGADVSPAELATRAQAAQKAWLGGNRDYRRAWKDMYGLTDGDGIAALLDPNIAMPIIEQRQSAVAINAAAFRQGLNVNRQRAEGLAAQGVDEQQALQGYSQIGETFGTDQVIAQRFGTTFSQAEEENDRLLGMASAQRKRKDLYGKEGALFEGASGSTKESLSKSTAGSY